MKIIKMMPGLDDAARVTASGFVQDISEGLILDVSNHLKGGDIVYSIHNTTQLEGFTVFKTIGDDVLYLVGIMLSSKMQCRGIAETAIRIAKEETGRPFLSFRTQSSQMWRAGQKLCNEWYPEKNTVPDDKAKKRLDFVCQHLKVNYPVTEGFYGGPLYGKKPLHHDVMLQKWWDDLCDFERGDAVLCLGKFK